MKRGSALIAWTIGFAVCYLGSTVALGSTPHADATGAEVVRWFRENGSHVRLSVWFLTFAMVFVAGYTAIVRAYLPAPHRDLYFIGAVTLIAETVVQGWIMAGLALHPGGLQPATGRLVLDVAIFWGPVLTSSTIMMLAPVTVLAFQGRGFPRWIGYVTLVALVEQAIETITIFGHRGFIAPGGPMNLLLGAGLTSAALIAVGISIARTPAARPVPAAAAA
jgi:hypothetical protein